MSIIKIYKNDSNKSISNIETLKKSKLAFDSIEEIIEYSNIRMDENTVEELRNSLDILKDLYDITYNYVEDDDKESLLTDRQCRDCNNQLLISDNIIYSYQCENCDENYFDFETKSSNDIQNSMDVSLKYDKDNETLHIENEYSSGEKHKCSNVDEVLNVINGYCKDLLISKEMEEDYEI